MLKNFARMSGRLVTSTGILMLSVLPNLTSAQSADFRNKADQYFKTLNEKGPYYSTALMAQGDKIIMQHSNGWADAEWQQPNTADTRFRIGSVTKQFTAVLILKLMEEGRLSLTESIRRFFPDFPKADSVTVHDLLTHTSGIASMTSFPEFWNSVMYTPVSRDSMMRLVASKPYQFSPGTRWEYNNSGYYMLGMIVEKVTGSTWGDYLRKALLDPLGLVNTGVDRTDSVMPKRARGYDRRGTRIVNATYLNMEHPYSAGNMYSTVGDLHKWNMALHGGKVLKPESYQLMIKGYKNPNYGYGIGRDTLLGNKIVISHTGGINGFACELAWVPEDNMTMVMLTNLPPARNPFFAIRMLAAYHNVPLFEPKAFKEQTLPASVLQQIVGKYEMDNGTSVEIVNIDGKLHRRVPNAKDLALKIESAETLHYTDGSSRAFLLSWDSAKKKITGVRFAHESGWVVPMKKIS